MSISRQVEGYINSHPSIKDCVKNGLVNYSALSRQAMAKLGIPKNNFDAVLIACRRHYDKLKNQQEGFEERILRIVRGSKLEIKNRRIVIVLEKGISQSSLARLENKIKGRGESLTVVEGSSSTTLVTSEEFAADIMNNFGNQTIKTSKNLVEVIMKSPRGIESTPGVLAYLTSLLSENDVNLVEAMSCWTETLFVVEESNIPIVMKIFGSGKSAI